MGNENPDTEDGVFLFQLPGPNATKFFRDRSRRVAKCRICSGNIPKNVDRIACIKFLDSVVDNPRGGKYFRTKKFFHPECIQGIFAGISRKCALCGLPTEDR